MLKFLLFALCVYHNTAAPINHKQSPFIWNLLNRIKRDSNMHNHGNQPQFDWNKISATTTVSTTTVATTVKSSTPGSNGLLGSLQDISSLLGSSGKGGKGQNGNGQNGMGGSGSGLVNVNANSYKDAAKCDCVCATTTDKPNRRRTSPTTTTTSDPFATDPIVEDNWPTKHFIPRVFPTNVPGDSDLLTTNPKNDFIASNTQKPADIFNPFGDDIRRPINKYEQVPTTQSATLSTTSRYLVRQSNSTGMSNAVRSRFAPPNTH